jgi:hypothetical protein
MAHAKHECDVSGSARCRPCPAGRWSAAVTTVRDFTEMPPEPDREQLELVDVQVGSLTPGRQPAQVD